MHQKLNYLEKEHKIMEGPITQNEFTLLTITLIMTLLSFHEFKYFLWTYREYNNTVLPSPDGVGDGLDVPGADVQGGSPEQPHLCPGLEVPHDALVAQGLLPHLLQLHGGQKLRRDMRVRPGLSVINTADTLHYKSPPYISFLVFSLNSKKLDKECK